MSKIIIDNRTDISLAIIFKCIDIVIKTGRISNNNKQYCYHTSFKLNDKELHISTDLNKKSDRFIVWTKEDNNDNM